MQFVDEIAEESSEIVQVKKLLDTDEAEFLDWKNHPYINVMKRRHRYLAVVFCIAIVLFIILFLSWSQLFGTPSFANRQQAVQRLEQTFPVLERYQVSDFRNQDWCRNIAYASGQFSKTSHPSTCNLFDDPALPFTPSAHNDFQAVEHVLAQSGIPVRFLSAAFTPDRRLQTATFDIDCIFCSRLRYVYQPHYGTLPEDIPNEMWFTRINDDWYIVEEDWM